MKSLLSRYRPGFSKAHFYRELRKDLHMAQHFAWAKEIGADAIAEGILTIHLDRCQRALAGGIGIEAGHVGQHADLDDVVGNLRVGRANGHGESEARRERGCN